MQALRQNADCFRFLLDDVRDPRFKAIAGTALGLIAIGSVVFWLLEGWMLLDAVAFSVMTVTTVGFGDLAARTAPGKIFTIVYVVLGVGLLGGFLSLVAKRASGRLERQGPATKDDEERIP